MNFLLANSTNHRRIIMFVATLLFGLFTTLVFYKAPLTFREVIFPPIVGLAVFELLFRTRKWLNLKMLPVYIIVVTILNQVVYSLLYQLSYVSFGGVWNSLDSLMYLFTNFPYALYFLIDLSVVTGLAYYLIKIYRNKSWVIQGQQSTEDASNEPIFEEGPLTFDGWLRKNTQQIAGFLGWYAIATLLAPFSFGLITTPVTLICLIAFGLSKKRKGVAGGILVAVALNLVISLIRGLSMNATCFIPFYLDMGF